MYSVEEVATAVRQVAAHEVRIEMLTARIDEMRDCVYRQQSPRSNRAERRMGT